MQWKCKVSQTIRNVKWSNGQMYFTKLDDDGVLWILPTYIVYPRPKNPNFSPTQHMYVLRPVYLETTSTKWHWQHPRHFYPRPYICMEQKENSNNCRSPNTKDILYACTYLNKWETPMNKLTSSICKPRSQKEFNKIACKYAPAVLYSNLGTILYAEFPKIGCKQEGSQIGNNKQNCHMRPKVE